MARLTQKQLALQYYTERPGKNIRHASAVDWLTAEWKKRTGQVLRDPDRAIRTLYQEDLLEKVGKGVYRLKANARAKKPTPFTRSQKDEIMRRGGYRCAVCGKGEKDGVELQVDHIQPVERGGKSILENGQVLCSQHNYRKKTYRQTETGKRMFINLMKLARTKGDREMVNFCKDVLEVYESHDINGHIKWSK